MRFHSPDKGRWLLLDGSDSQLCTLPCEHWVGPDSGYKIKLDADKAADSVVLAVPSSFDYSPGRTLDARVKSRKWPWVTAGIFGGLGLFAATAALAGGCDWVDNSGPDDYENCDDRDALLIPGLVAMGVGVVFLVVGAALDRRTVDLSLAAKQTTGVRFGPGNIEARFPGGQWLTINPGGVTGVF